MRSKSTFLATQHSQPALEIVKGEDRGRRFALEQEEIRLGRSPESDIVLNAEGISRHHATLQRTPQGTWMIVDNQSKNGVVVNGSRVGSCLLRAGDIVQIGSYAFRFQVPDSAPRATNEEQQAEAQAESLYAVGEAEAAPRETSKRPLIYGVSALVIFAMWYLSSSDPQKPDSVDAAQTKEEDLVKMGRSFSAIKEPDLKIPSDPNKVTTLEDPILKRAEQDMSKLDWTNTSLREAEQFFRRGQRDYLSRNFGRAIDSFQTALSLYRGHELAEKYLARAMFETEQEAKKHMEIAVGYFDSLQYQRSIYHFSQVINLLTHRPTEPIVVQAEKYIGLSKKRLQSAELFP